jgi:hypothetical protein
VFDDTFSTLMNGRSGRFFHSPESWFGMRDLGAVLEQEEPLPHPASDQVQ